MLTREEFSKDTLKRELVTLPDGSTVRLRQLSVGELTSWRRKYGHFAEGLDEGEGEAVLSLVLVALSLEEDEGSPMFRADEIEEGVALLQTKSEETVIELQKATITLNGMTEEALAEAVGNLPEIPAGSSSVDSPGISDTRLQTA